ncbi:MAG: hypothetical protein JNJ97_05405, partial [Alphaproteobacteria bacterium]|nr:hypothetical protein [Alphaproteobacteria bacterium]
MSVSRIQKRKGYLAVGAAGLLLSASYLGASSRLPFGELARPGAGVFPLLV